MYFNFIFRKLPLSSVSSIHMYQDIVFLWRKNKPTQNEFQSCVCTDTFCRGEVKEPNSASRRRCCPTLPVSPHLLSGSAPHALPAWFKGSAIGWDTRSRDNVPFQMYSREFQKRRVHTFSLFSKPMGWFVAVPNIAVGSEWYAARCKQTGWLIIITIRNFICIAPFIQTAAQSA